MQILTFSGKHVPVSKAAKILGKNEQAVRVGLQKKELPIGYAIETGETTRDGRPKYTYYISPKLIYEQSGVLIPGEYEVVDIEEGRKSICC